MVKDIIKYKPLKKQKKEKLQSLNNLKYLVKQKIWHEIMPNQIQAYFIALNWLIKIVKKNVFRNVENT